MMLCTLGPQSPVVVLAATCQSRSHAETGPVQCCFDRKRGPMGHGAHDTKQLDLYGSRCSSCPKAQHDTLGGFLILQHNVIVH
eukprot:4940946-Amphidinium_carterae.1